VRDEAASADLRIGEWVPAQRGGPPAATPAWAESEETVALPAFLRGLPAPGAAGATTDPAAPPEAEPDGDGDRLPSSERNMLIFVSSLLAAGTLAGFYVEAVVVAEKGAWPLGLPDTYAADLDHLAEYAKLAATPEGFGRYIEQYVRERRAA